MKKIGSLLAMMMMLTFTLASCGSDDNEEVVADTVTAATAVSGEYVGYTEAQSLYFKGMYTDDQTVTVTGTGANTVTITYTSETWGTFTITDAAVVAVNGGYSIVGEGVTLMGHAGSEAKEYPCTFNGTVDADGNPVFTFSAPTVMGGLTLTLYPGNAPSTED